MRSELGKITLDKTFEERASLNAAIVASIQDACADWGLRCMRYEIRDIQPPPGVRAAMELQAEAERRKRAQVLESEGQRQSAINVAEGNAARVVLESQAAKEDAVNRAEGQAAAVAAIAVSAGLGLLVSLSTFLVIGATSSLTYNVVGHIKTVIILAGGCLFFGDEMPPKKLAGRLSFFF